MEGRIVPLQGDASLLAGKRYDFVLANINRNILLADMPVYAATLTPGGMLLVSGILEADISAIESRGAGWMPTACAGATVGRRCVLSRIVLHLIKSIDY